MPSIFPRIVSGEIPALILYEDHETLAFMDINPASRGHTLAICKHEYPDIFSIPPTTLAAVMHTTQQVALALRSVVQPDGINIIQNNAQPPGKPYSTSMCISSHVGKATTPCGCGSRIRQIRMSYRP